MIRRVHSADRFGPGDVARDGFTSPFVTYPEGYFYTKTNHFPKTSPGTYQFVNSGPIVDGQIQPLS